MKKSFKAIFILFLLILLVGCTLGTALTRAAYEGRTEEVKALLDKGANIDERPKVCHNGFISHLGTCAALGCAAVLGHTATVKLLLDRGADVDPTDSFTGFTPLSMAANKGHYDIVKLLLERGADVNRAIRLVRNNSMAKEAIKVLEEFKERKIDNQPPRYGASPPMLPTALPLPTEPAAPF